MMNEKPSNQEKFRKKLLVEGINDQHVVWALCQKFKVIENFDVVENGSVEKLLNRIPARIYEGGIEAVGIVVDVDFDFDKRWKQIVRKLPKDYLSPDKPSPAGTILEHAELPKIGIWMMPNSQSIGKIEDFLKELVPANDQLLPIADATLLSVESQSKNLYPEKDRPKALLYTWLAWQEKPGMPYGQAITAKALTTDTELCEQFIAWLHRLFS